MRELSTLLMEIMSSSLRPISFLFKGRLRTCYKYCKTISCRMFRDRTPKSGNLHKSDNYCIFVSSKSKCDMLQTQYLIFNTLECVVKLKPEGVFPSITTCQKRMPSRSIGIVKNNQGLLWIGESKLSPRNLVT